MHSSDTRLEWVEWTPANNPLIRGRYTRRTFDEDGLAEEQRVEASCSRCGATWQGRCLSGQVRSHIARFSVVHLHRDTMAAPRVERPGSLRRRRGPDGEYEEP